MKVSKFILCFIVIVSIIPAYTQDTTVTEVGDGFIHYHIFDPDRPQNINVLEIDVSNPDNTIGAGLANDVMAQGLERTSGLSARNSESGHIVVGAINGDFYGLADPFDPYGYLSSSMIMDDEYVFGRKYHRSLFGVVEGDQPVIDVLEFDGTIEVNNNYSPIHRFNAQRVEDAMVLFNRYFGESTLTNEFGTEVRLEPIDDYAINTTIRFLVAEVESNIGDMTLDDNTYVLSGHGTSSQYLTDHMEVNDTVSLFIGTQPDRGKISALVGGGPRLLTDGTRPDDFTGVEHFGSNFIETRHPRTAVGFNADSTVVYFVTVDGRQPGFSAGMSLYELADFMISFGISHAVNLDGGGSTTMTVHDQVVNSPSDPGGERSVANALFAVSAKEIDPPQQSPVLVEPADGASDQPDTLILSWGPVEQAVRYTVEVSPDESFTEDLIHEETVFMDTTSVVTDLVGMTEYFWRVKAHNAAGDTDYSEIYSFTTGFPLEPELQYPEQGNTDVPVSPTFEWTEAGGAEQYKLQLARANTFTEERMVLDTIIVSTTLVIERELEEESIHFWRVRAFNEFGSSDWSDHRGFRTTTVTYIDETDELPEDYNLKPNYPNPFNPNTMITFALPERDHIVIQIYSITGEKITTLVDGHFDGGIHTVEWRADGFASGVYYCVMEAQSGFVSTEKMILVR